MAIGSHSRRRSSNSNHRNASNRGRDKAIAAAVESLERRCLLSVSLDPAFGSGGLAIAGASGAVNSGGQGVIQLSGGQFIVGGTVNADFGLTRFNSDGTRDTTFGNQGSVRTSFPGANFQGGGLEAIAATPDGKIVALGLDGNSVAVARYNSNGSLDTTFNGTGQLTFDFTNGDGDSATLNLVAVDSSNRIVIAGTDFGSQSNFAVARLTPAGALDTSFNGSGEEIINFGDGNGSFGGALALTAGDGILLAGSTSTGGAVASLNADGSLNSAFNGTGLVSNLAFANNPDPSFSGVAVDSLGRVDLTGLTFDAGSNPVFGVLRLKADGTPDTTFNLTGEQDVDFGGGSSASPSNVGVLSDGTILVGGSVTQPDGSEDFAAAELNDNGSPDLGFNSTGTQTLSLGAGISVSEAATAVDSAGNVLMVGEAFSSNFTPSSVSIEIGLGELTSTGSPDTNLNGTGTETVAFTGIPNVEAMQSALQADGKIVVAFAINSLQQTYISRFNADGSLDSSFGGGGLVEIETPDFLMASVAVGSDGTIYLAGSVGNEVSFPAQLPSAFEVMSFTSTGQVNTAFNGNGDLQLSFAGEPYALVGGVAVDGAGNVVLAGGVAQEIVDPISQTTAVVDGQDVVARLLPDGNLDTTFNMAGLMPGENIFNFAGSSNDELTSLAINAAGEIAVGGAGSFDPFAPIDLAVARLGGNGSLDFSFGTMGSAAFIAPDGGTTVANSVAIDAAGNIVAAGYDQSDLGAESVLLTRFALNGTLDASFNPSSGGYVELPFAGASQALGVAEDALGNIVVAGLDGNSNQGVLAEFNANGSPNTTFSPNGTLAVTPGGDGPAAFTGVAFDSAGRVLATGISYITDVGQAGIVARYAQAAQSTSVAVTAATAAYGDSSVELNAAVSSGSAVNTGNVTFTVTDSLNHVLATLVSTVSGGAAQASLSLTGVNAGAYTVTAAYADTDGLFTPNSGSNSLTVNAAALTITVNPSTSVYGASLPSFSVSTSPFVSGDSLLSLSGSLVFNTAATSGSGAGAYSVTASGLSSGNYSITYQPGTLTITPAALTITVNPSTSVYGTSLPSFGVSTSPFVSGDNLGSLSGTLVFNTSASSGSNVGSYAVTASGLSSANYNINYQPGTLSITAASLVVSANNASMTQGDPLPTFSGMITGVVNGDAITASYSTAAMSNSAPGNYAIVPSLSDPNSRLSNYNVTLNNGTLTIVAQQTQLLTVTVNPSTSVYGSALPAFSVSYSGFVNGDGPGSLSGTLVFNTAAVQGSSVGSYAVSAAGLSSGNYVITFQSGLLSITPAALNVNVNNATATYGSALPGFSGTVSGNVNSDNITASYSTSATPTSGVGAYPITAVLNDPNSRLGNYNVTIHAGTLTVGKASLNVTVNNASRAYGAANPAFSAAFGGLVSGDNITANFATSATATSAVGTYPISATLNDPNSRLGNYNVTITAGTLTVTKAALTVAANPASKVYGQANPALSGTITGLVNGNTINVSYATTATTASGVGSYPITAAVTDPHNVLSNYTLTVTASTLSVTPATLTITANNATKVYGSNNPTLSVTYSGFVNGNTSSVLTHQPAISTTAALASNVGSYPITVSGATAANYTINYVAGTLSITPASLVVYVNSLIELPSQTNPNFTVTYVGFVLGQNSSVLGGTLSFNESLLLSLGGIKIYLVGAGGLTSTNYNITYVSGVLIHL